ncbi:amidohydrolase [Megasphaera sueciensis]|uniref:amidohydrolase n=1 Tax=Megasphaera sueciensis TaxID=349094 RepID=UPI003D05644C
MDKKTMKDIIEHKVEEMQPVIYGIAEYLHSHPEIGTEEKMAADYLCHILAKAGFLVTPLVPEKFPTAFHAVIGNGPFQMGFLAEYDALPEIGHACGHNLIAAMSIGAAIAFAAVAKKEATIHVYGCPAEETEGSKVYMSEQHIFDMLDAAVIIHPSHETAIGGTSYATHPLQFTFTGKSAHVADPDYHGINALDALVDFYGRLKQLDATFTEPHIIGAIITEGGLAPNIIPHRSVLKATIRALKTEYLEYTMLPQIRKLAQQTAEEHGTALEMVHYEPLCKDMVNDPRMDVYFAENFNLLHEKFAVKENTYASGSTDVGNVSYDTRVCQPEIEIGEDIAAHTPGFASAAGSMYGKLQALTGAKAMAMVAVDVLFEPEFQ